MRTPAAGRDRAAHADRGAALAGRAPRLVRQHGRRRADDRSGDHRDGGPDVHLLLPVGAQRGAAARGRRAAAAQLALLRALPGPDLHRGSRRLLQAAQRGLDGDAGLERGRAVLAPVRGVRAPRRPRSHRPRDRPPGARRSGRLRQPLCDQARRLALVRLEGEGGPRGGLDLRLGARRHAAEGRRAGAGGERAADPPDPGVRARCVRRDRLRRRDHRVELQGGGQLRLVARRGGGARAGDDDPPRGISATPIARASSASSPPGSRRCSASGSS